MILRRLLFSAVKMVASNPAVQKQAAELTRKAVTKARPGLLKASRRAGELVRTTSDELADGVKQFKQGAKPKMPETVMMLRIIAKIVALATHLLSSSPAAFSGRPF
mgnify:CR=1 FL=1